MLAAPGTVSAATRLRANVHLLSAADGGRHIPIVSGYRPQFHLRTTDVVGTVELLDAATARPGETVEMHVRLGRPVPLEVGQGFAVRDGGRTVAAGTVTAVLG